MRKLLLLSIMLFVVLGLSAQDAKYRTSLAGVSGETILLSTNQIIEAGELSITPAGAQITGFTLEYMDGGTTKTMVSKSKSLTKDMKTAISNMEEGDIFYIKNVKAVSNGRKGLTLPQMKVKIKPDTGK